MLCWLTNGVSLGSPNPLRVLEKRPMEFASVICVLSHSPYIQVYKIVACTAITVLITTKRVCYIDCSTLMARTHSAGFTLKEQCSSVEPRPGYAPTKVPSGTMWWTCKCCTRGGRPSPSEALSALVHWMLLPWCTNLKVSRAPSDWGLTPPICCLLHLSAITLKEVVVVGGSRAFLALQVYSPLPSLSRQNLPQSYFHM